MKHAKGLKSKYLIALAHIGAFFVASAWGVSFLSTKVLLEDAHLTPTEMFIYRFGCAYLILLCFTFKNILSNSWRDELIFILCGICSGSLYFITENYALQLTTAGNVSMLASLSPLFTTFLVAAMYKQKIKSGVLLGSIVSFVGAAFIIFSHGESMEFRPTGDILAITASLSWAIYTMAIKRVLPLYSGFFITRKLFLYGVVSAIPFLLLQPGPSHLSVLFNFATPSYFFNFMFLVLICSIGAYIIWNVVMDILGPVATNNYLYFQPVMTMISAYFVLGENIYLLGYLGSAMIIGGLILSDKYPEIKLRR